jgi:nucleoid-associated protein YgaU
MSPMSDADVPTEPEIVVEVTDQVAVEIVGFADIPVDNTPEPVTEPEWVPKARRPKRATHIDHVVAPGESPYKIARRFYGNGGALRTILDANPGSNFNPGDTIKVPV